jgi:tryptophan-rich sensory protein
LKAEDVVAQLRISMGQYVSRPEVFFIGVPLLLGQIVGSIQLPDVAVWYQTLKKPSWTPPVALFPIMWTIMYTLMGYASFLVWSHGGYHEQQAQLLLYGLQLFLNLMWPILFFKAKKLRLALVEILGVLAAAAVTARQFYKVDPRAGQLMIPYLLWLAVAAALNLRIVQLGNPDGDKDPRMEDLYSGDDKKNPGEAGYRPSPTSASLPTQTSRAGRRPLQIFAAAPARVSTRPVVRHMPTLTRPTMRTGAAAYAPTALHFV